MVITQQFKNQLYNYMVKRLNARPYKHGWLRIPICPYCHREEKMGVNLTTYRTNCFRCGEHPSPAQMVMDIEGLETYSELISFLKHGNFEELVFTEEKVELAEPKPVYLPEGFKLINQGTSQLSKAMQSYVRGRGFDVQELSRHGVGYCNQGQYFGYLIIPFYKDGKLIYYNARQVVGNGPRYNNPDKAIAGVGKEFIIFNSDALDLYNAIYICEGAINALTLGERSIATMGKAISRAQINMLIKAPVKRYIICLDHDAEDKAIDLALKLVPFKKVKVIRFNDNRDVNDLGKKEVMKLVYKTRYQDYRTLIKMRNEL